MKVIFKTNIDIYEGKFPSEFPVIPRKGEKVAILPIYNNILQKLRLPCILEVKEIIYHENYVEVELWYDEFFIKVAKECDINIFP